MDDRPTFILAGNGPYENRGCEAIVRGTVKIIRQYYDDPSFFCLSQFHNQEIFEKQFKEESDPDITHEKTNREMYRLFSPKWSLQFLQKTLVPNYYANKVYSNLFPTLQQSKAVLSLGGDNYSLDYGGPKILTLLDDIVLENKKPIIIWGASVGPFSKSPNYEKYMKKHLKQINGIFAREKATIEYLESIGITENVYKVSDPAFLLDSIRPQKSKEIDIEKGSIGINLSPLMAKYVTHGDVNSWTDIASSIITELVKRTENKVYLIPHVTVPNSDDYSFLKEVQSRVQLSEEKVSLIPPIYNASETKWIINQMEFFAGARTHSTIAAISSCVPTLSFIYSLKGKGINNDIFGHDNYSLNPELLNPESVANKIEYMMDNSKEIVYHLRKVIPMFEEEAYNAGKYLQNIVD